MQIITRIILASIFLLFSSLINLAFADDDVVKFKLEIKPNQQKVEAKIDGDEHKQIQIRAEYVKLNTVTNNYHIKVTITNNSGQVLYHQLALIEKVEHSEVKYPDSTTDYIKYDDGKQITKTLPYYNYGNIKSNQTTPREWYLLNIGKEEIWIEGYIISKEIAIVLDPKIVKASRGVAKTMMIYLEALRDNDLDKILSIVPPPNIYFSRDIPKKYKDSYKNYPGRFLGTFTIYNKPESIAVYGSMCNIHYNWYDPETNQTYPDMLELQFDGEKWWITD